MRIEPQARSTAVGAAIALGATLLAAGLARADPEPGWQVDIWPYLSIPSVKGLTEVDGIGGGIELPIELSSESSLFGLRPFIGIGLAY